MKTIFLNPFLVLFGLFPLMGQAQYITVSGYVTHFFTSNAIENVNVFETRSGIGTITDKDGFFRLIIKQGEMNITFAQSGFKPIIQQFLGRNDTTLNIQLEPLKWIRVQDKHEQQTKADNIQKESASRRRFLFF